MPTYIDKHNQPIALNDSVAVFVPGNRKSWMAQVVQLLPRYNSVVVRYLNNHTQVKNTQYLLKVEKLQEGHVQQWGLWNNHQLENIAHEIQRWLLAFKYKRERAKDYLLRITPTADFNTLRKAELALAIATRFFLLAMKKQVEWYQAVGFGPRSDDRNALRDIQFYYNKMSDDLRQIDNDNYNIFDNKNPHLKRVQGAWYGHMKENLEEMKKITEQKFDIAFNAFQRYHALRRMHFIQQAITSEPFELSAKKFVDEYHIALTVVDLYRTTLLLLSLLHFDKRYVNYYTQELENHLRQFDDTYQTFINYK